MNHSALTDLLYGVSLPGSQFPHLYNEGPGFESGWPRLVGQTRAWRRAGPAGVLALLPPSPVTGGTALILGPCLSGRCEPYPRWHSPGSGKFPSPTCRSLSSSPSRLLGHPRPLSHWPLSATHLLQGSLLTPPPNLSPSHRISSITADRSHLPVCLLDLPGAGRGARLGRRLRFLTQGFLKVPRSYRPGPPPSGLALSKQPTGEPGACQTTIPQTRGGPGQSQPGRRAASRPPHLVP